MGTTLNRTWGLLFGGAGTKADDWIRPSDPAVPVGGASGALAVADPNIRGWLVEAVVQAALRSSWRGFLEKADPVNTYDLPLLGETAAFTTDPEGWGVIPDVLDRNKEVYRTEAVYTVDATPGNRALLTADEIPVNTPAEEGSRAIPAPFAEEGLIRIVVPVWAAGEVTVTVTGRVLPKGPPLDKARRMIIGKYPGRGLDSWPTQEIMGWLAAKALGGGQ